MSRAICLAAYEKPVTVEEISISTGIPTMYIEDELKRLEYGDAVKKINSKYATDFIIFRLKDRKKMCIRDRGTTTTGMSMDWQTHSRTVTLSQSI